MTAEEVSSQLDSIANITTRSPFTFQFSPFTFLKRLQRYYKNCIYASFESRKCTFSSIFHQLSIGIHIVHYPECYSGCPLLISSAFDAGIDWNFSSVLFCTFVAFLRQHCLRRVPTFGADRPSRYLLNYYG
jgi:hypothetical protein